MKLNSILLKLNLSKTNFFLIINLSLILSIAVVFRLVDLGNIPGINGDEAWYGVQMLEFRSGSSFAWRTPTGNLVNPFFSGVIFLLQLFFPPSFWILRITAAISGILAIFFTYYLISEVLGKRIAIISTLLVATLPINIGYSRFGWDQSQAVLVSVIAIYFALKQNWLGLILLIIVAFIIHPTNIFLFPFLVSPLIFQFLVKFWIICLNHWKKLALKKPSKYLLIFASILLLILFLFLAIMLPKTQHILGSLTIERLVKFTQTFSLFLIYFGQLLSGVTIYRYIVEPDSSPLWLLHDVIFWTLFLPLIILGIRQIFKERNWLFLSILLGLFVTLVIFYFISHLKAIMPGYERYPMCLIMPSIIVFSILINSLFKTSQKSWIEIVFTLTISWLLLWSFQSNYFQKIQTTGGRSELTFRTANIEPKQQAFSTILENSKTDKFVTIITEDWWTYWPIRYLAEPDKRIKIYNVVSKKNRLPQLSLEEFYSAMNQGSYAVGFASGKVEKLINQKFTNNSLKQWDIADYSGQRLLSVWQKKETQE